MLTCVPWFTPWVHIWSCYFCIMVPMGQSLVINPHILTKRAPHRLETPQHKGRGEPRSPDQWSVSCFSTIWHAEGFLRYSCAKKHVNSFFLKGNPKPEGHRVGSKVFSLVNKQLELFSAFNDHIDIGHHDVLHLVNLWLNPTMQNYVFSPFRTPETTSLSIIHSHVVILSGSPTVAESEPFLLNLLISLREKAEFNISSWWIVTLQWQDWTRCSWQMQLPSGPSPQTAWGTCPARWWGTWRPLWRIYFGLGKFCQGCMIQSHSHVVLWCVSWFTLKVHIWSC